MWRAPDWTASGTSRAPRCAPTKTRCDCASRSGNSQEIATQSYCPRESRLPETPKSRGSTTSRPFFVSATTPMPWFERASDRSRPRISRETLLRQGTCICSTGTLTGDRLLQHVVSLRSNCYRGARPEPSLGGTQNPRRHEPLQSARAGASDLGEGDQRRAHFLQLEGFGVDAPPYLGRKTRCQQAPQARLMPYDRHDLFLLRRQYVENLVWGLIGRQRRTLGRLRPSGKLCQ